MAELVLSGVRKFYGTVPVLRDVDLEVSSGEFIVLVGPSGCGKSTLLRMIAGLEELSAGQIFIDGRQVNDVAPKDRNIAMVFQSYALYPHMTVRENMGFGLKLKRVPAQKIEAAVGAVAENLELTALLDRLPKELSGGQRQRVAMGRAMVRRPKVFLFDEPLSNLDASLRQQVRLEIARMHDELDATIVYVTHDQVEAMTLADRLVVLNEGVVQQVGAPLEVYANPANRFVASFIGSPSINFLRARAADGCVEWEGGPALRVARSGLADGPCTLGLRPEAATLDPTGGLGGTVDVLEPMGAETYLHLLLETGEPLHLRVDARRALGLGRGTEVRVKVDPEALHVFDAAGHSVPP